MQHKNHPSLPEKIKGIVQRVTYHNEDTGWSVLKVRLFQGHDDIVTVTVHQVHAFAGATMAFTGAWTIHPRFGRQFKAVSATELKPATAGALEKYLSSGLIKGVGPKTAARIVRHFGRETLRVFEEEIERLTEVPGIANKKLTSIRDAWQEHKAVREIMIFLQTHGISTLFAVRIFQLYGEQSISLVSENPYRLASDFYGIGFFTADRVALSIGFVPESELRVKAAIRHTLSASREQGHCYLTLEQITQQVCELLDLDFHSVIQQYLRDMEEDKQLRVRRLSAPDINHDILCYYAKSLFYDEEYVARRLLRMTARRSLDEKRAAAWLEQYGQKTGLPLSREQNTALLAIAAQSCSILTGGPGCGKTTTTRVLVDLLHAMGNSVLLAAPTGRAAQRMSEVIGVEAKTIHRLLEFQGTGFKRREEYPLETDFLIIDECSMLDISLTATLLRAVAPVTAVLFIGDPDQLPSVGAGNVLRDMINSRGIPCYHLTEIFRQARQSSIVRFAHAVNEGNVPAIQSPFKKPDVWKTSDCFFIDTDEATGQQLRFIARVKRQYHDIEQRELQTGNTPFTFGTDIQIDDRQSLFHLPDQYQHVSVNSLVTAESSADQLLSIVKKVHPWSSLYYGLTALDVVRKLYAEWIPKYFGKDCEIQILSPMIRGSLGTANLNTLIQEAVNPQAAGKHELLVGEKLFRVGDRVIHRRNNYDLGVFNGDIGTILRIDNNALACSVSFFPDHRVVKYEREQLSELDIAYAITVHKAQGSEFDVVIFPLLTQHYRMLFRNLVYTGVTRARKLAVFVGTRRAFAMAVHNIDTSARQTALASLLSPGQK